jgi:hypothetical protein
MKTQWKIQRQFVQVPYSERRWDQAYQLLLTWSEATEKKRAATTKKGGERS